MASKVFISGYVKPTYYNGGIQYRNFSDNLVGNQNTDLTNSSLFTLGNFIVSTNFSPREEKNYKISKNIKYYTLDDLIGESVVKNEALNKLTSVKSNLDWNSFKTYAYFGSLTEFLRVSLENVVMKFPSSFKSQTSNNNHIGETIKDVSYDNINNISNCKIPIAQISNPFEIDLNDIPNSSSSNILRVFKSSYSDYVISFNGNDYPLVGFTGKTLNQNEYIFLKVKGDLTSISGLNDFHVKPSKLKFNEVYNTFNKFEQELLNNTSEPLYTSKFTYDEVLDNGLMVKRELINSWPITDGYNIDFQNKEYFDYVSKLLEVTNKLDEEDFDIIRNFLVAKSISEFDTSPSIDGDIIDGGKKITNLLRLFGRQFDDRKNSIDGIANANKISYNKKENAPNVLIKDIARNLGWDLTNSMIDNEIINNYLDNSFLSLSGNTVKLSKVEAEQELWRRLILNSSWLFKSKGTRKPIEFLLRFIGTPNGLVSFNEYIYKAKEKIDYDLVLNIANKLGLGNFTRKNTSKGTNDSIFNFDDTYIFVDNEGYPNPINEGGVYFQNYGGWWRESNSEFKLDGNNPHFGIYDNGYDYINRFTCLFPNVDPQIIRDSLIKETSYNLFNNYSSGTINDLTDLTTYVNISNINGVNLNDCYELTSSIINDPKPTILTNECNCETDYVDQSLKISIKCKPKQNDNNICDIKSFNLSENGEVIFTLIDNSVTNNIPSNCCLALGFQPALDGRGNFICLWKEKNKCLDLEVIAHTIDGYAVFKGDPNFTVIRDPECCLKLNSLNTYTAIMLKGDGYSCKRNILKQVL